MAAHDVCPGVPPPLQAEQVLPQTHGSDTPEESSIQIPHKNAGSHTNSTNSDTKVDHVAQGNASESVAENENEKPQGEVKDHATSIQKLEDRVSGLEQRLRQAGLLEEPKNQSDSQASPNAKSGLNGPERNENSPLATSTNLPSSHDEVGEKGNSGQVNGSLKDAKGLEDPAQVLGDRIDSLEKRLEQAGHLKDKPAPDKPRLPAIPRLHYVDWSDFKNKLAGEERSHAVEVLIGGAKYYHQRSEEERKSKQRSKDHANDRDQPGTEDPKSTELPERIRINSKPILLIMKEIDPMNWTEDPTVILRPYKPLIYHEVRIREVFQKLESRWGNAEMEASASQAVETAVTKAAGDGITPALSDEPTDSSLTENDPPSKMGPPSNHNIDFDAVIVKKHKETVTQRERTPSPPAAKTSPASLHNLNDTIEKKGALLEAESPSPQAIPEVVSDSTRNEETEDTTDSVEALSDLRCLIKFIDVELKPVADSYRGKTRQRVFFSDLWHLFKPGDFLYRPLGNTEAAEEYIYIDGKSYLQKPNDRFQEVMRIACTAGGRPLLEPNTPNYSGTEHKTRGNAFLVAAYWVDFSDTRFVPRGYVNYMIPFSGERDITSLEFYPLRYSPKADEQISRWKARGEAFREYTTFKYRYYTGKSLTCTPDGYHPREHEYPKHTENVDSQVVVDFGEAFVARPRWRVTGCNLTLHAGNDAPGELAEAYPTSYWKDSSRKKLDKELDDEIYHDFHIDLKLMQEYIEGDPLLKEHPQTSRAGSGDFGADHLVLLPNRVFAFVMKDRKWAMLTVDGLRPIKRYDEGFRELQLPMGHKRTVSSLVKHHFLYRNPDLDDLEASYDADLVRGKGKGLIILLHGAPGVGKTSTAETVADAFGKLLFPITCGDLGLTAADVERELSDKFHLAELWDCVLLLDEADVFLARRTNTDIKRNSLVSVFLRVLEHFTGVLFLTTNRVGAFDEAFKSRIHISLYYPPLDAEMTHGIWKVNLERLIKKKQRRHESIHVNEKEIYAYAQDHYTKTSQRSANWNGRQIRNAFQTATALAEFEAYERNKKAKKRSAETGDAFLPTEPELQVRHFREIASSSYEFDEYIFETRGATDAEMALLESQRMDEYRPNKRLLRDKELSASGNRQVYSRTPVSVAQDTFEGQDSIYHQPPTRRITKSTRPYGVPNTAAIPRSERLNAARSQPKPAEQPTSFTAHDRGRRRHEVFDQHEPHYEDEDEEDPEHETYVGSLSQPRRRQVGELPAKGRKSAVLSYDEDLDDNEYTFDN